MNHEIPIHRETFRIVLCLLLGVASGALTTVAVAWGLALRVHDTSPSWYHRVLDVRRLELDHTRLSVLELKERAVDLRLYPEQESILRKLEVIRELCRQRFFREGLWLDEATRIRESFYMLRYRLVLALHGLYGAVGGLSDSRYMIKAEKDPERWATIAEQAAKDYKKSKLEVDVCIGQIKRFLDVEVESRVTMMLRLMNEGHINPKKGIGKRLREDGIIGDSHVSYFKHGNEWPENWSIASAEFSPRTRGEAEYVGTSIHEFDQLWRQYN